MPKSISPYLDTIGFTDWFQSRVTPEVLHELDGLFQKTDAIIDKFECKYMDNPEGDPLAAMLINWSENSGPYESYFDLFDDYRLLMNELPKVIKANPQHTVLQKFAKMISRIYELLPPPSLKEFSNSFNFSYEIGKKLANEHNKKKNSPGT